MQKLKTKKARLLTGFLFMIRVGRANEPRFEVVSDFALA